MYREFISIIYNSVKYRKQILQLAMLDQKKSYRGSDLGRVWAFVKPAMYVCAFYVAITIGFKSSKDIEGIICPYFIWLTVGLIAWFYMRDMILGGASCFRKNRTVLVKCVIPNSIVPMIPAVSNLVIHFILMIAVVILALLCGVIPNQYWIQLPLYTLFMFVFSVIWSFGAGCLATLSRDFYNLLKSISTMVFWLSGILFDSNSAGGENAAWFFRFNPVTYIVEGYRNALCREVWFFEEPVKLCCFFITMIVFCVISIAIYQRVERRLPDIV